jgi:hypothetical protein
MVLADDIGQVLINMQDKVDQVFDDFQLRKILPKIEIKPGLFYWLVMKPEPKARLSVRPGCP